MEAVAAAAGVSKATPYLHFANSNELLVSLLESELATLEARAAEAMPPDPSFEDTVRAGVAAWFDLVTERGDLLGALLQAGHIKEAMRKERDAYYRGQEAFYGRLLHAEFGIPEDVGAAAASALLIGLAGILDRWTSTGETREVMEETYIRVVMAAVYALADDALAIPERRRSRR